MMFSDDVASLMTEFNQNKSNVCIRITLNSEPHFSQFNLVFGSHFDRLSHFTPYFQ